MSRPERPKRRGAPSLPLFVDDFEAATPHLNLEQDGAYNRLMRLCWRTPGCSIPDDEAWIKRHLRCSDEEFQRSVRPVLDEFFKRSRSRLYQRRLRDEFGYVMEVVGAKKTAGKLGGEAKARKANEKKSSATTVLPEQNASKPLAISSPSPSPSPRVEEEGSNEPSPSPPTAAEAQAWSADDLFDAVIQSVGLRPDKLPAYWLPASATIHVNRWRTDLGIPPHLIVQAARESRLAHPEPPSGPRALDRVMKTLAATLAAPKMEIPDGHDRPTAAPENAGRGSPADALLAGFQRAAHRDGG